jgi:hypothetical protein
VGPITTTLNAALAHDAKDFLNQQFPVDLDFAGDNLANKVAGRTLSFKF